MVLLSIIDSGETYGYEIVRSLNEYGGRIFSGLSARNVYPTLHRLEFDGLINMRSEKVKGRTTNFYSITDKGRKILFEMKEFWKDYVISVSHFVD